MVTFDDIQALARFGHGHLKDSHFVLLEIKQRGAAGRWLQDADVNAALSSTALPETALQIAFTPQGLEQLGLDSRTLSQFSDEFLAGMGSEESRSRRLGDVGNSAPEHWYWGHKNLEQMHVLLLLYAREGQIERYVETVCNEDFHAAFNIVYTLPTNTLGAREPFGFVDGISQPAIDWEENQRTDAHARETYSNLLAPGEIVLGYTNEYGQFTHSPCIEDSQNACGDDLPAARGKSSGRDFGHNGSYLVLRQLEQNVDGFWQFMSERANGDDEAAKTLAERMVGRHIDGEPLVATTSKNIPGISSVHTNNQFDFDSDPIGLECPVGAHIRRSNPRTGDFPARVNNCWLRLFYRLGFKRQSEHEDLVASTRFHRILRRGRTYGQKPAPPGPLLRLQPGSDHEVQSGSDHEVSADAPTVDTGTANSAQGLQFICVAANILRQFEFVQSAWSISTGFAGTRQQRDPITAHRQPLDNGTATDLFMQADQHGSQIKTVNLPEFVTVRGGGYFFMPGIRAIRYLGRLASTEPK